MYFLTLQGNLQMLKLTHIPVPGVVEKESAVVLNCLFDEVDQGIPETRIEDSVPQLQGSLRRACHIRKEKRHIASWKFLRHFSLLPRAPG